LRSPSTDGVSPIGALAIPGPGDEIGTPVFYDNGFAYWQADSGRLSLWLTASETEYRWAC
jgi:hypothetical protein